MARPQKKAEEAPEAASAEASPSEVEALKAEIERLKAEKAITPTAKPYYPNLVRDEVSPEDRELFEELSVQDKVHEVVWLAAAGGLPEGGQGNQADLGELLERFENTVG